MNKILMLISIAQRKTAVSPLLMYLRYQSLALSLIYVYIYMHLHISVYFWHPMWYHIKVILDIKLQPRLCLGALSPTWVTIFLSAGWYLFGIKWQWCAWIPYIRWCTLYLWMSAWKMWPQCFSNGVTSFLNEPVDMGWDNFHTVVFKKLA